MAEVQRYEAKFTRRPDLIHIYIVVISALAAFRLITFLTGYVQEDAYITFRTSFNLADHGVYSFNLDSHYPGATSILYGLFVALLRLIFGSVSIDVIGLLGGLSTILASLWLAEAWVGHTLRDAPQANANKIILIWLMLGLSPPALQIGASGMETSILIAVIAFAIREVRFGVRINLLMAAAFALPLVRLDAISAGLIIVFALTLADPRRGALVFAAMCAGLVMLLELNMAFTDHLFPVTAIAKEIAYAPSRRTYDVLLRVISFFLLDNSYFIGVSSKYIPIILYMTPAITFLFCIFYQFCQLSANYVYRMRFGAFRIDRRGAAILVMCGYSILPPLFYCYGGVVFPWYLWPSSMMSYAILLGTLVMLEDAFSRSVVTALSAVAVVAIMVLSTSSILTMLNLGYKESHQRTNIGKYISAISGPNDTLFLEPAGFIPFYARIKTYDEVGLTSAEIVQARSQDPAGWWMHFLMQYQPTFLVQRNRIEIEHTNYWGTQFNPQEIDWFNHNYTLEKEFSYSDILKQEQNPILRFIASFGSDSTYYLYRHIAK